MVRVVQVAIRRVIPEREMAGRNRRLRGRRAPGRGRNDSRHGQLLGEFTSIHYSPLTLARTEYSDVRAGINRVRRSFPPNATCSGRSGTSMVSINRPEELYT